MREMGSSGNLKTDESEHESEDGIKGVAKATGSLCWSMWVPCPRFDGTLGGSNRIHSSSQWRADMQSHTGNDNPEHTYLWKIRSNVNHR